jgi:hypothetical protein
MEVSDEERGVQLLCALRCRYRRRAGDAVQGPLGLDRQNDKAVISTAGNGEKRYDCGQLE